ncbi:unnamed protein product [Cyclocybe aegerita]|uniref:SWIM-type domain-containing protein n=1 Tax=Cyclocybe aegerita TaxID=1973307 RepID=A0A8S0WRT2_CYCAE|nr:unnamed protein product [Cyclocybe aegerita]
MPPKASSLCYATTGKACYHILAVRLQIDHGSVKDYIELETSQKLRGPAAKGQTRNPIKEKTGRRHQAASDATVTRDLEKIFLRLKEEEEDSDSKSLAESPISDIKTKQANKALVSQHPQTPQKGRGVTAGRRPAVTPLHPNRTPVKFSQKTGPKPKPHNSLLPSLPNSPIKPVNFSPKKLRIREFLPTANEEADLLDEQKLSDLDFSRWNNSTYMLRQDEISLFVDLLNSINTGILGSTLVIPDTYAFPAQQLAKLDWTLTDSIPVGLSGDVYTFYSFF